jgi:hypothetical protein
VNKAQLITSEGEGHPHADGTHDRFDANHQTVSMRPPSTVHLLTAQHCAGLVQGDVLSSGPSGGCLRITCLACEQDAFDSPQLSLAIGLQ